MVSTTLYDILGVPEDVPPSQVGAAALFGAEGGPSPLREAARAVLSDPDARADYDARRSHGLALELAWAWGIAAFAANDVAEAAAQWERALRMAPEDRALPLAIDAATRAPDALPATKTTGKAAVEELGRLRNNSAFPHRLIRYAAAMAEEETNGDGHLMAGAAKELLQYDIAEAPRVYAMTLPVLRDHYRALYALDAPFFDASLALLEPHGRPARAARRDPEPRPAAEPKAPPREKLPPLHMEEKPAYLNVAARLAAPGVGAFIGAALGALLGVEDGLLGMVGGAVLGYGIVYFVLQSLRRR